MSFAHSRTLHEEKIGECLALGESRGGAGHWSDLRMVPEVVGARGARRASG